MLQMIFTTNQAPCDETLRSYCNCDATWSPNKRLLISKVNNLHNGSYIGTRAIEWPWSDAYRDKLVAKCVYTSCSCYVQNVLLTSPGNHRCFPYPSTRCGVSRSHRKSVVKPNSSQTESVGPMSDSRVPISAIHLYRVLNIVQN